MTADKVGVAQLCGRRPKPRRPHDRLAGRAVNGSTQGNMTDAREPRRDKSAQSRDSKL